MTKHEQANLIHSLFGYVGAIQTLTSSDRVSSLCVKSMDKLVTLRDGMGLKKHVEEIKSRQIDPTS